MHRVLWRSMLGEHAEAPGHHDGGLSRRRATPSTRAPARDGQIGSRRIVSAACSRSTPSPHPPNICKHDRPHARAAVRESELCAGAASGPQLHAPPSIANRATRTGGARMPPHGRGDSGERPLPPPPSGRRLGRVARAGAAAPSLRARTVRATRSARPTARRRCAARRRGAH
eukprot:scaffold195736_cov27-Tisochrysis_lutea.AAC.6